SQIVGWTAACPAGLDARAGGRSRPRTLTQADVPLKMTSKISVTVNQIETPEHASALASSKILKQDNLDSWN
ncbi:MAG: hypothetical protein ACREOJ_07900, partial [Gemmatimonadaceae bacterium]